MVSPAILLFRLSLGLAPDIDFLVVCTGTSKLSPGLSRLLIPSVARKTSQHGERNSGRSNGDDTSSNPLQHDRGGERTTCYTR